MSDRRHPFLTEPPIAMAHRGGGPRALENSLAAFQDAVDLGYRYLETDVHATADGVLVAFHDDHLDRVTDGSGAVADLPWSVVGQARIAGREPVPLLEEVVASFPTVRLNLDVKSDAAVAPLIALLGDASLQDRVCVGSFEDHRVAAVREACPGVCRSASPTEVRRLRLRSRIPGLGRLLGRPADCVQVPVQHGRVTVVDERFVAHCHQAGLQVHVWTVNDRAEMHRLLDLGVDGLITDETRRLREVLVERGRWAGPARSDEPGLPPSASPG